MICAPRLVVGSLFVPYGQSLGRTLRNIEELAAECPHDFFRHSRETISVTLHRLKKRKLIKLSQTTKRAVWRTTQRGKDHFRGVNKKFALPPTDGKTRVIVFDIPEHKRGARNWLRGELLACDYAPLQKSVFIGTRPLPAKMRKELKKRDLLRHVQIMGLEDRSK